MPRRRAAPTWSSVWFSSGPASATVRTSAWCLKEMGGVAPHGKYARTSSTKDPSELRTPGILIVLLLLVENPDG